MKVFWIHRAFVTLLGGIVLVLLSACQHEDTAKAPPPVVPDREAMTWYGRMILVEHRGPKAQIFLRSRPSPLWFSQVRDAIAFTLSPEDPHDITAIYVTDMGGNSGWDSPQRWNSPQQWLPADKAIYVIDSDRRGGMGALEAVPFSRREAAEAFVHTHGGQIVAWNEIPRNYILVRSVKAVSSPSMMH